MLIVDAVECMAQPRDCEDAGFSAEAAFVKSFRSLLNDEFCVPPRDLAARLRDAWQRLESSGLVQRRKIDKLIASDAVSGRAVSKAAAAAAADPGLRSCGLAGCGAREAHPAHFKSCAACRGVAYCCKEHQTAHWPSHKGPCKAARKAAAAAADDGGGAGPSGT
jgi:hypothetical protein